MMLQLSKGPQFVYPRHNLRPSTPIYASVTPISIPIPDPRPSMVTTPQILVRPCGQRLQCMAGVGGGDRDRDTDSLVHKRKLRCANYHVLNFLLKMKAI